MKMQAQLLDVQVWWIYHKILLMDPMTPAPFEIESWIKEVHRDGSKVGEFHSILWRTYPTYRDKFFNRY